MLAYILIISSAFSPIDTGVYKQTADVRRLFSKKILHHFDVDGNTGGEIDIGECFDDFRRGI